MKLFFTPPVLTVLVAPLPLAGILAMTGDLDTVIVSLGLGWVVAFQATVSWLLLVAPLILVFGKRSDGGYGWIRVLLCSSMGGFCVGALYGFVVGRWRIEPEIPHVGSVHVVWGVVFSYVSVLAASFLMKDSFFRPGNGKI